MSPRSLGRAPSSRVVFGGGPGSRGGSGAAVVVRGAPPHHGVVRAVVVGSPASQRRRAVSGQQQQQHQRYSSARHEPSSPSLSDDEVSLEGEVSPTSTPRRYGADPFAYPSFESSLPAVTVSVTHHGALESGRPAHHSFVTRELPTHRSTARGDAAGPTPSPRSVARVQSQRHLREYLRRHPTQQHQQQQQQRSAPHGDDESAVMVERAHIDGERLRARAATTTRVRRRRRRRQRSNSRLGDESSAPVWRRRGPGRE